MKKGRVYIIFAITILVSIAIIIHAATTGSVATIDPGHNSTQIFIPVGNSFITLQSAIDTGYLLKINSSPVATTAPPTNSPYHFANQTLINVTVGSTNYTMTLQEAITNNVFVTGASLSYTRNIPVGEYGYNINVNTTAGIKNLYYAIKNNLLSSSGGCPTGYTCGGTSVGSSCYPTSGGSLGCAGKISSSGTCSSFVIGYTCGGSYTKGCDGSGYCVGYSGNGCGNCPFGTHSSGSDTLCNTRSGGLLYTAHPANAAYQSGVDYCGPNWEPTCHESGPSGASYNYDWVLYPCAFG